MFSGEKSPPPYTQGQAGEGGGGRSVYTQTQNNPYLSAKTDPTLGFPGVTQLQEHVEKKCISPKHWTYM